MAHHIEIVDIPQGDRKLEREFIQFPHRLYKDCPYWVPWFNLDMKTILRRKHPFFLHATGDFFLAQRDGETVGTMCVVDNPRYNDQHKADTAHFYFFEAQEDQEIANALFERAFRWTRERGLKRLSGPMLFGGASGSGILIKGFEQRAAMTMMRYNYPYYQTFMETMGFEKQVDLFSSRLDPQTFILPDRVRSVAEKVLARGRFKVLRFKSKRDLKRIGNRVASMYNTTLGDHPEDYPMSDAELKQLIKDLIFVADPDLIKILTYDDAVVGYLLAFPDLSAALQRAKGRITPFTIIDILREFKRTKYLIINGAGILPEYQRLGGNALLYYELERTGKSRDLIHADLTQVAESTSLMLRDLQTLGGEIYKVHRMYTRTV